MRRPVPALAVLIALCGESVAAEEPPSTQPPEAVQEQQRRASVLLEELRDAARRRDGSWRSAHDELCGMGAAVVPVIRGEIGGWPLRDAALLVGVLGGISGDESTALLLELATDESRPQLARARSALARMENRPVNAPLSKAQVLALSRLVEGDNVSVAGVAARVLGMCRAVPGEERARIVLARFMKKLKGPPEAQCFGWRSYVSPQVYVLNQFLLAFSYIGEAAIPPLRAAAEAEDAPTRKWVHMALGMAGDEGAAEETRRIVESDPDRYVRCVAIRAYARAAGEDAIPLLTSFLDDETQSEYQDCRGERAYLIRLAARGELARLERESRRSGPSTPETAGRDVAPPDRGDKSRW